MPLVNVRLIEGVFTQSQKQDMIRKLTDTMVSIEGENMRPVTWVIIEEVKTGHWGMAGKPLTTADVLERKLESPKIDAIRRYASPPQVARTPNVEWIG
jgi:4-oxalocrotonate tautomerase